MGEIEMKGVAFSYSALSFMTLVGKEALLLIFPRLAFKHWTQYSWKEMRDKRWKDNVSKDSLRTLINISFQHYL